MSSLVIILSTEAIVSNRSIMCKINGQEKQKLLENIHKKLFLFSWCNTTCYDTNASIHFVRQLDRYAGFKTFNTANS